MQQSYHPIPQVDDVKVTANISELFDRDKYLNNISGISRPHVFHIKKVRNSDGELRPAIYTKGFWSKPLTVESKKQKKCDLKLLLSQKIILNENLRLTSSKSQI